MKFETLGDLQDQIKLIYYSSQDHKTLYFQMQLISIRCSNIRESIKSELILNKPEQCMTNLRKLENSPGTRNAISEKTKKSNVKQVNFINRYFCWQVNSYIKNYPGYPSSRDVCYGSTAGIQCLCISLLAVCWSRIRSISRWDSNDLNWILRKGHELFKSINKFPQ